MFVDAVFISIAIGFALLTWVLIVLCDGLMEKKR